MLKEEIEKALEIIKAGGIILYPTETHFRSGVLPSAVKNLNC